MTGLELIAQERERQINEEGFTVDHDKTVYTNYDLSKAAVCYIQYNWSLKSLIPAIWPWDRKWWKPKSDIRNLVKAGALIAAEIDRLQSL